MLSEPWVLLREGGTFQADLRVVKMEWNGEERTRSGGVCGLWSLQSVPAGSECRVERCYSDHGGRCQGLI